MLSENWKQFAKGNECQVNFKESMLVLTGYSRVSALHPRGFKFKTQLADHLLPETQLWSFSPSVLLWALFVTATMNISLGSVGPLPLAACCEFKSHLSSCVLVAKGFLLFPL